MIAEYVQHAAARNRNDTAMRTKSVSCTMDGGQRISNGTDALIWKQVAKGGLSCPTHPTHPTQSFRAPDWRGAAKQLRMRGRSLHAPAAPRWTSGAPSTRGTAARRRGDARRRLHLGRKSAAPIRGRRPADGEVPPQLTHRRAVHSERRLIAHPPIGAQRRRVVGGKQTRNEERG